MVLQPNRDKRCIVEELASAFENWARGHRYHWETEYRLGDVIPAYVGDFGKFLLWRDSLSTARQTGKSCLWNNAVSELLTVWGSWIQAGEAMTKVADTIYVSRLSETLDAVYAKRIPSADEQPLGPDGVDLCLYTNFDQLNKSSAPLTIHRPKIRQADWDKYYLDLTNLGKLED